MKKSNKKLTIKALVAALAMGFALNSPLAVSTVHAELVDETDEWNREGEQQNQDVTEQEQQNHDNNSNEQDANAHVDNSNGGSDQETKPDPVPTGNPDPRRGEVTDWENYDPTKDPNWDPINPVLPDGLEDEVDRKSDDTPTPTPTPTPVPKTGDSTAPYAVAGVVLGGSLAGFMLVVDSKRKYRVVKDTVKTLTKK